MKTINLLVWITQFGISVITPILLYLWLAVWLQNRFGLGPWILVILGLTGIISSIRGAVVCLRFMCKASEDPNSPKRPPVAFNNHN